MPNKMSEKKRKKLFARLCSLKAKYNALYMIIDKTKQISMSERHKLVALASKIGRINGLLEDKQKG